MFQMHHPDFFVVLHSCRTEVHTGPSEYRSLLGKKRSVEVINWQEGLTKLRIAQHTVSILVESPKEGLDFLRGCMDAQTSEALTNKLQRNGALAMRVQQPKGVNQVKVTLE